MLSAKHDPNATILVSFVMKGALGITPRAMSWRISVPFSVSSFG